MRGIWMAGGAAKRTGVRSSMTETAAAAFNLDFLEITKASSILHGVETFEGRACVRRDLSITQN